MGRLRMLFVAVAVSAAILGGTAAQSDVRSRAAAGAGGAGAGSARTPTRALTAAGANQVDGRRWA